MRAMYLQAGDVRTRCLVDGDGDAVLLLHGVGLSADLWLHNVRDLGQRHRMVAPDLLGHGFTSVGEVLDKDFRGALTTHICAVMDALALGSVTIVGSSVGALVAALVYFRMPDRVKGLVIVGSGSCFTADEAARKMYSDTYQNAMTAIKQASLESCRARLARICWDARSVPEEVLLPQLTSYALPEVQAFYEALLDDLRSRPAPPEQRVVDRLGEIRVPTLVISGREDPRCSPETAASGAARIPQSHLTILPRCGHLPFLEYPNLFNSLVSDFVEGAHNPLFGDPSLSPYLTHA